MSSRRVCLVWKRVSDETLWGVGVKGRAHTDISKDWAREANAHGAEAHVMATGRTSQYHVQAGHPLCGKPEQQLWAYGDLGQRAVRCACVESLAAIF